MKHGSCERTDAEEELDHLIADSQVSCDALRDHLGGEKARALLIHRVAALKALSASPLLLLDEPLEHLDPRNRWTLARMISDLTSQNVLEQVLITTYEESLARKLALSSSRMGTGSVRVLRLDSGGRDEA